jgi:hypothetical protein
MITTGLSFVALGLWWADVYGVVKGANGEPVSSTTVRIANMATGKQRLVASSPVGEYRFTKLDPGAYTVSAEVGNDVAEASVSLERKNSVEQLNLSPPSPEAPEVAQARRKFYREVTGAEEPALVEFDRAGTAKQRKLFVEACGRVIYENYLETSRPKLGGARVAGGALTVLSLFFGGLGPATSIVQGLGSPQLAGDPDIERARKLQVQMRAILSQAFPEGSPVAKGDPVQTARSFVSAVRQRMAAQRGEITLAALYTSDMDHVVTLGQRPGEFHIAQMFGESGLAAWKSKSVRERSEWLTAQGEEMLRTADSVLAANLEQTARAAIQAHPQLRESYGRLGKDGLARQALGESAAKQITQCSGRDCDALLSATTAIMLTWNALASIGF